jgi:hypothetical protein
MDLKEIMSVSGQSGLFRFISQGRNGIIVESFTDNKRSFVNTSQKVSSLGDIAIFTENDEVPLKDVLKKIHELQPGIPAPDHKSSPDSLREFMDKVLPDYDRARVYISDIKKLVSWYNTLLDHKLLNFEEETVATEPAPEVVPTADKNKDEESVQSATSKPVKPAAVKKAPAAKKPAAKK